MANKNVPVLRFLSILGISFLRFDLYVRAEDCDAGEHTTSLEVAWRNTTAIGLEWSDSLKCADQYTVSWCYVPLPWFEDCTPEKHDQNTSYTSYVITDLQPCSYYWVTVSALRSSGATFRNSVLVITAPAVKQVKNVQVSDLGDSKYAATWDVEGDDACIQWYKVCWQAEGVQAKCDHSNYTNYELPGEELQVCTNYTVSVASLVVSNNTLENATAYFLTGPANVGNLNLSEVTSNSALLTWKPSTSSCAENYILSWCLAEDYNGTCGPVSSTTLNATINHIDINLEPCIYNVISLSTVAADGRASATGRLIVNPKLDKLGPPTEVTATPTNSGEFTLGFGPPENATYCVAEYVGCFKETGTSGEPTCSQALASGFWTSDSHSTNACTHYDVTLTAISKDNKTAATSLDFTTPPDAVKNLKLTNGSAGPGGSFMIVSWNVSVDNHCMTYQHIRYSSFDEDLWVHKVNLTRDVTKYVITDLTPCTQYALEVVEEPFSEHSNTTTMYFFSASNVTAVSELNVTATGNHSVNISYLAPEASARCVSEYRVCWRQTAAGGDSCQTRNGSGMQEVYVEGLTNCTGYTLSVTPVSPGGEEYTSTAVSADTTGCS